MENSENKNESIVISAENWTPIVKRRRYKAVVKKAEVEKTEVPAPKVGPATPEKPEAEETKPIEKAEPMPEKKEAPAQRTEEVKAEEPTVEVIPEESIEPVNVKEEASATAAKPMTRRERKALLDKKEEKRDRNDDGSIFTTKEWRALWDKICFVLLVCAIGIPVATLVYIIAFFFL